MRHLPHGQLVCEKAVPSVPEVASPRGNAEQPQGLLYRGWQWSHLKSLELQRQQQRGE